MPRHRKKKLPTMPATATIEKLSHDGKGIAHIEGKTTFVLGALPQETVTFYYTAQQRHFDEGVVAEVLQASPERIAPACPHFGVCGGCSAQHMSPDAQRNLKQAVLLEQFAHFGKVTPEQVVMPLQGDVWGYRHKARLGVKYVAKKQSVLVGFREQRSNFLADIEQCPVLHPTVGLQITALRKTLTQLIEKDKIAQIEVAVGENKAALVFRNLVPLDTSDRQKLCELAQQMDAYFYLQPKGIDSVVPLYPEDLPLDSLYYQLPTEEVTFQFAAHDFTQVNPSVNRQMVPQALDWLDLQTTDCVLDLFCGLGNFTLPLAKRVHNVVGVEGSAPLLERAQYNAQQQGINNVNYHVANLAEMHLDYPWLSQTYDKVLLDPPRSGALEIIQQLTFKNVTHVVYVSCNPATLARDAEILVHQKGFRLIKTGIMDMFPHTAHVESMALFVKES